MTSSAALRVLLLDLDNTVYAYAPCHRAGLMAAQVAASRLDPIWCDPRRFESDYLAARAAVKAQIGRQAAAHCRLLYFKAMVERHSGRSRLSDAKELHAAYWRDYFAAMRLDEECAETLGAARDQGLGIVWVTSFTTERQILKLEHLGLSAAADFLLTTEEAGVEKPSGHLVDLALRRLGAEPEGAWVIGDSLSEDLMMAEARRLPFVWFRRDGQEEEPAGRALYTVTSWKELGEILHDARNA